MEEAKENLTDAEFYAKRTAMLQELEALEEKYGLHVMVAIFGFDQPDTVRSASVVVGCRGCAMTLLDGLAAKSEQAKDRIMAAASADNKQTMH